MKYFVTQARAVRIDEFQFRKDTLFEVSYEKAQYLYGLHGIENEQTEDDVKALFERGQFVNIHKLGLLIYGKEHSDNEVFKRRLNGKIAKEIWK